MSQRPKAALRVAARHGGGDSPGRRLGTGYCSGEEQPEQTDQGRYRRGWHKADAAQGAAPHWNADRTTKNLDRPGRQGGPARRYGRNYNRAKEALVLSDSRASSLAAGEGRELGA